MARELFAASWCVLPGFSVRVLTRLGSVLNPGRGLVHKVCVVHLLPTSSADEALSCIQLAQERGEARDGADVGIRSGAR